MGVSILSIQISHHRRSKIGFIMVNTLCIVITWACQMTSRTKLKRKQVDDILGKQDFGADETTGKSQI